MSYFESMNQIVSVDDTNSSTANLAAGATFTGAKASTLGIAGIQVSLSTDKNCDIFVDQSSDGDNWDITDEFEFLYTFGGKGFTVQAVTSYYRIRVTNNGASTTGHFRLQTCLCPIVEALPRSLDEDGNLRVGVRSISDDYGFEAENTPMGEHRSIEPVRLIGTSFEASLDTNFWSSTLAGSGAVSVAGQAVLTTGATANSTVQLQSVRRARHYSAATNRFRGAILLPDAGQANNIRRWGVYDANNGFFFQLSGTTFSVVTRKGGVDTVVPNGSFNGDLGNLVALTQIYVTWEIYITSRNIYFVLSDEIIHTVTATTAPIVNSFNLPITFENNNSSGSTTNVSMSVLHAAVYRLGKIETEGMHKNIVGAATTTCKLNAGKLHQIIINSGGVASGSIAIYDNTAASGTLIGTVSLVSSSQLKDPPTFLEYDCPFFNGLTIVTVGTGLNITVVYE